MWVKVNQVKVLQFFCREMATWSYKVSLNLIRFRFEHFAIYTQNLTNDVHCNNKKKKERKPRMIAKQISKIDCVRIEQERFREWRRKTWLRSGRDLVNQGIYTRDWSLAYRYADHRRGSIGAAPSLQIRPNGGICSLVALFIGYSNAA